MDYQERLSPETYPFLTEEERAFLLQAYLPECRLSLDSRKNILYILGSFSNFLHKPLFAVTSSDVPLYLAQMERKVQKKEWKKEYAACIYSELSRFYEVAVSCEKVAENPFRTFFPPYTAARAINPAKFPTLLQVDELFSDLSDQPELYLAAALAFRMALPLREIVSLRKDQVCFVEEEQSLYLEVKRGHKDTNPEQFLFIPEDLHPLLKEVANLHPDSPYFFPAPRGGCISRSGLQHGLQRAQRDPAHAISLSDLRSLSIYLMMVCQIPAAEVSSYAGITDSWLVRYTHIASELKLDASRFVNLRLEPRIRP